MEARLHSTIPTLSIQAFPTLSATLLLQAVQLLALLEPTDKLALQPHMSGPSAKQLLM